MLFEGGSLGVGSEEKRVEQPRTGQDVDALEKGRQLDQNIIVDRARLDQEGLHSR